MIFPEGSIVLKDAPVQFVNFDNILNHAKKTRERHLVGYIEIIYPDSLEYLFFKDGETIGAACKKNEKLDEYPLKEVLEKAKNAHKGRVNIHRIDIELLSIIISLFKEEPLFSNKSAVNIDFKKLFNKFSELDFSGFLAMNKKGKFSFVKFRNGKPDLIYPLKKEKKKIDNETLKKLLKKEKEIVISAYRMKEQEQQASPALIDLYLKFFNSLIKSFVDVVGPSLVRRTLIPSYENAAETSTILENFEISEDLDITYKPFIATDEQITEAFALWIDQFSDAIFAVLGRKTDEIIHNSIKDYRFALKSAGFFEASKLKRLDLS